MEIYTIGFTQTTARDFFGRLKDAGIRRLIDVRLNNSSQLAGFAKRDDVEFFLEELCGAEYVHEPRLAPTQELLDGLKKHKGSWQDYEAGFDALLRERRIEDADPEQGVGTGDAPGRSRTCARGLGNHCSDPLSYGGAPVR